VNSILVRCEDPPKEAWADLEADCDKSIDLRAFAGNPNLRFESLGKRLHESLNPLAADLARVGAYVYAADRLVTRGGEVDVFGEKWSRSFTFVVPVSDDHLWQSAPVRVALQDALAFVSEDRYEFRFVKGPALGRGEAALFRDDRFLQTDSVALFSGGLDSLAGVVFDFVHDGRRPVLVSHYGPTVTSRGQKLLVDSLGKRFREWDPPHAPVWINFIEPRQQEYTQRSRSFLYLSLAAAVAHQLGKREVSVYENGIVSINLPISAETVGARLTRTTHPEFVRRMRLFLEALLDTPVQIRTPFAWLTKKDVAVLLADAGSADLIAGTTSCGRTFMKTKIEPQCGVCSQCLDRRVALEAARLQDHDTNYRYDMYTSPLGEVEEKARAKAMALGFAQMYTKMANLTPDQFLADYPEVLDLAHGSQQDPEEVGLRVYELYQRQAEVVRQALSLADERTRSARLAGMLPKDCLLQMVYGGQHTEEPLSQLARKIGEIAEECLPRCFASEQPRDEAAVRDALHSQLAAAGQQIAKECPVVSFLVVKQAKPDLSAAGGRLFVEVKYPRESRHRGAIAEEIGSDLTQYRDAGATVLFVVYDPHHKIMERRAFVREIETHEGAFARVIS